MNNEKEKYPSLFNHNEGNTNLFEKELKDYIINLKGNFFDDFKNIYFRECSSNFYYAAFDSMEEKKAINFENCHFFFSDITHKGNNIFKDSQVTFTNCTFTSSFNISPDYNYPDIKLKYKNCTFSDTLKIISIDSNIIFNDCSFNDIELKDCNIQNNIFTNKKDIKYNINKFTIDNCTFKKRFTLNNYNIGIFTCTNCVFQNKFEFKNNNIIKFDIHNSNFKEISDMFASKFIQFKVSKSIFNDFSGFENCIFGTSDKLIEEISEFKYVTFKDILTLRKTEFLSGLDIENINLQNDANFLKTKVELENTPRETFRLIKHSFDKIGNIIEANKFYSLEMKKREKELAKTWKEYPFEWLVFKFHSISSNHSQNWTLSLFWIYIISLFFSFFVFYEKKGSYLAKFNSSFENSWLSYIYTNDSLFAFTMIISIPIMLGIIFTFIDRFGKIGLWSLFCLFWTGVYILGTHDYALSIVANSVNPFSIITEKGTLTLGELLYRIIIAYLIYQLIISIRQNTRRK